MNSILALDTSGKTAGVAILQGDNILYEATLQEERRHAENILPMVDAALRETGLRLADMELFACVVGPGSFTGIRIGVSTVRGFAHGLDRPCVGINALEALDFAVAEPYDLCCPILDARSGQVYGACFEQGTPPKRRMEDTAGPLSDFLHQAASLGNNLCFVGDGAAAYREEITRHLGDRVRFAPEAQNVISPATVCRLARLHAELAGPYSALLPHYLRAPQAERERLAKEEAKHAGS